MLVARGAFYGSRFRRDKWLVNNTGRTPPETGQSVMRQPCLGALGGQGDGEGVVGEGPGGDQHRHRAAVGARVRPEASGDEGVTGVPAEAGSLLVMGGSSQHHWLHAVPKVDGEVGTRSSLTVRRIVGAALSGRDE